MGLDCNTAETLLRMCFSLSALLVTIFTLVVHCICGVPVSAAFYEYFHEYYSGLLEDQVKLKEEEIRNKMTKRPITPPPSHSHMEIPAALPEILPPNKQEPKQDLVVKKDDVAKEPAPKVCRYFKYMYMFISK